MVKIDNKPLVPRVEPIPPAKEDRPAGRDPEGESDAERQKRDDEYRYKKEEGQGLGKI
jgi:hypothetical protein